MIFRSEAQIAALSHFFSCSLVPLSRSLFLSLSLPFSLAPLSRIFFLFLSLTLPFSRSLSLLPPLTLSLYLSRSLSLSLSLSISLTFCGRSNAFFTVGSISAICNRIMFVYVEMINGQEDHQSDQKELR